MSGLKCAEWVPAHAAPILQKEFAYWQDALDHWPSTWALPLRVGPPTRDTIADLMRAEERYRAEMQFWQRLANDPAMEKVYEDLDTVGFDKHRLADFLDAAWGACLGSLSEIRKGRARTRKLMPEIGEKALELKALIEQLDGSVPVPSELLSVVSLLRSAEEQPPWPCRQYMVGEKLSDSPSELSDGPTEVDDPTDPLPERTELDPELLLVDGNRAQGWMQAEALDPTIWKGAPTVVDLLQALGSAAQDWDEQTGSHDPVEAALSGDKSNERTEYLRALVAMLEERGILVRTHVKPEMRRAIVGVARVVLEYTNDSDPTLFEDAMTRALNRLLGSD